MKRFKRHRDYGFFDQDLRLSKLSQLGDPSHANPPQRDPLGKGLSKGVPWTFGESFPEGIPLGRAFGLAWEKLKGTSKRRY